MKNSSIVLIRTIAIIVLGIGSFSLLVAEGGGGDPPTCMAGGCYATECSWEGTLEVLGVSISGSSSITCITGTYACCNLTAHCFLSNLCPPLEDPNG